MIYEPNVAYSLDSNRLVLLFGSVAKSDVPLTDDVIAIAEIPNDVNDALAHVYTQNNKRASK